MDDQNNKPQLVKVQQPASKNYKFIAIPKRLTKFLAIDNPSWLCWTPLCVGNEDTYEDVAVVFTVDNPHDAQAKLKKILKLIEE